MLRLQLLGGWRLSRGDADISGAIHYRKGWALLAYLAIERGRRHSREQIAELLWPALAPAAARTNLRQVLADLNQAFDRNGGKGMLETSRDGVGFFPAADAAVDVLALGSMQPLPVDPDPAAVLAAEPQVELFRGVFMAGFQLSDCVDYEQWLEGVRRRLSDFTLGTLSRLCRAQQAHGRVPQAIATARQLVVLDGWHEGHQRQLMQLLCTAGLHQQALEQYRMLEASLQEELGTRPEARTQALHSRIQVELRRAAAKAGDGRGGRGLDIFGRRGAREVPGAEYEDDPDLLTQHTLPVSGVLPGDAMARGWLEVEYGVDPGRRIPVAGAPVLIGRSRDSHLCVSHDTVSRQHCAVWHDNEDGFRIRDLGSTNGTRVNDAVVQEAALRDGDRIVLGDTVLRFGCEGAEAPGREAER